MKNTTYIIRLSSYGHVLVFLGVLIIAIATTVLNLSASSPSLYDYLICWAIPIVVFVLLYRFPLVYLKVIKQNSTVLDLQEIRFGKIKWTRSVSLETYWWNYTDIDTSSFFQGRYVEHPNHPKNTGTGNMDSSGIPTEITLYVKMVDTEGRFILLYDEMGNWASIPPWKYELEKAKDSQECIPCKGLKKLIKGLNPVI